MPFKEIFAFLSTGRTCVKTTSNHYSNFRSKMAAIISQLAANKRARAKRIKNTIPIEKSVYFLPPFDPAFDPCVHNKYLKAVHVRQEHLHQQRLVQQEKHQQRLLQQQQQQSKNDKTPDMVRNRISKEIQNSNTI